MVKVADPKLKRVMENCAKYEECDDNSELATEHCPNLNCFRCKHPNPQKRYKTWEEVPDFEQREEIETYIDKDTGRELERTIINYYGDLDGNGIILWDEVFECDVFFIKQIFLVVHIFVDEVVDMHCCDVVFIHW